MDPSGDPLAPVPVVAAVAGGAPPVGNLTEGDPRFAPEPVVLGSEDLQAKPTGDGGGTTKVGSTMAPAASASGNVPIVDDSEGPQSAAQASADMAAASSAATMGWPIRLVRTHLDEQPPSAVLALPDGRRIVVSPGDMVPERGLVVMAIGKERVHLAAINSKGDHATVVPMELTAQY